MKYYENFDYSMRAYFPNLYHMQNTVATVLKSLWDTIPDESRNITVYSVLHLILKGTVTYYDRLEIVQSVVDKITASNPELIEQLKILKFENDLMG